MTGEPVVWIVNQYALRPNRSGGTRHYELSRELEAYGVRALVVHANQTRLWDRASSENPGNVEAEGGVLFLALRGRSFVGNGIGRLRSTLGFALRVLMLRIEPRPILVVGSSPDLLGAAAAYGLAKKLRVPFVLEVRDVWPASLIELLGVSPRHPYAVFLAWLERFLYVQSAGIIGVLPGVKIRVAEIAGEDHATKVVWIPNSATSSAPRSHSYVERQEFRVVYTGAHGGPNALHTVLEAASLLRNRPDLPEIRFDFYGDGALRPELEQMATTLGLVNVTFHDPVEKSEVLGILRASDLAVLPGLDTQLYRYGASPNKLFDYMAAEIPVLTSLSMIDNPVSISGCGFVVQPEDSRAFAGAIADAALKSRRELRYIGARSAAYLAQHHSTSTNASKLARMVARIVARKVG